MDTIINYVLVTVLGIALFVGPVLIVAFLVKKKKGDKHTIRRE